MKKNRLLLFSISLLLCLQSLLAQSEKSSKQEEINRPKIVIGMVVDQMCWDYLYRYYDQFEDGGFKRLMREGFNCENTRINYLPSVTAIGHSSVYTGSIPSLHGITGNHFIERGKRIYCTEDRSVHSVGAKASRYGMMSPKNMKASTIGDELRLATNFKSKVIGLSLKDRGAILPAGHSANAAYWLDNHSGNFMTSSYYMEQLPQWLEDFNKRGLTKQYLNKKWSLLKEPNSYHASSSDDQPFEGAFIKGDKATLPIDLASLSQKYGFGLIRSTPFGNSLLLELAKATINGEKMGAGSTTDMLTISLSATDYIGHQFGTFAQETEDCYLRLDRDLAQFFQYLDQTFGKDAYLFFLTADHAAAHNINFLQAHKLLAKAWNKNSIIKGLRSYICKQMKTNQMLILDIMNYQVHINEAIIQEEHIDRDELIKHICTYLEGQEGVSFAVDNRCLSLSTLTYELKKRLENSYNAQRSGAVSIILDPAWYMTYGKEGEIVKGTSHGVWAPYDTHIPLIFMGQGIKAKHLYREVEITDISATLAFLLKIQLPNACIGKPILEILEN